MDELKQLQAKMAEKGGFFGLTKEEKERYKKLKGNETGQEETNQSKTEPKADQITLSKQELDNLILSQVNKALQSQPEQNEEQGTWKPLTPEERNKKHCTFRYYQDDSTSERGIIIDLYHHKWDFDERSREYNLDIYIIKVLFDDGSIKEYEMPLERLINFVDSEKCEIVEESKQTLKKNVGRVVRPGRDKSGYILSRGLGQGETDSFKRSQGGFADLVEVKDEFTFKIQRPSGQIFTTKKINL